MATMNFEGRLTLATCIFMALASPGCGDDGGGAQDASTAVDAATSPDSGASADDAGALADGGTSDAGAAGDDGGTAADGGGAGDAGNRADAGSTLPEFCGGLLGMRCPDTHYCDYPDLAMCGFADGTGTCEPRPELCTDDCPGVCGCDGNTYCNRCDAAAMGVDTLSDGLCSETD